MITHIRYKLQQQHSWQIPTTTDHGIQLTTVTSTANTTAQCSWFHAPKATVTTRWWAQACFLPTRAKPLAANHQHDQAQDGQWRPCPPEQRRSPQNPAATASPAGPQRPCRRGAARRRRTAGRPQRRRRTAGRPPPRRPSPLPPEPSQRPACSGRWDTCSG
jgi:hypothetical protein